MSKLSIVIPIYHNEGNIEPLYKDIKEKLTNIIDYEYEIILVDDGSTDKSWEKLKKIQQLDRNIRIYHLSRNFGSYSASLCGIQKATGDCIVVKSADLQEPTEMIHQMYERWKDGNNVVLAVRTDREEGIVQKSFAYFYYWVTRKFSLKNMPPSGFDTYLIDRQVADTLVYLDEKDSALNLQLLWCGYKTAIVPYIRRKRTIGKSQWTLKKKIKLFMDTIYGFSDIPILAMSLIGFISVLVSIVWTAMLVVGRITNNIVVAGWTTIIVLLLLIFGIMMISFGIIGGYLWRTFNAVRKRPPYIVEDLRED